MCEPHDLTPRTHGKWKRTDFTKVTSDLLRCPPSYSHNNNNVIIKIHKKMLAHHIPDAHEFCKVHGPQVCARNNGRFTSGVLCFERA